MMSTPGSTSDAKPYAKMLNRHVKAKSLLEKGKPNIAEDNDYVQGTGQLVPSRWSHTGWRYVEDLSKERFFSNPNRFNS